MRLKIEEASLVSYYKIFRHLIPSYPALFSIDGKNSEVTGQKKRVGEIVSLAREKGFDIPKKSIKHYASCEGGVEYVLVKW